jgi:transcriptional regulator with XRE-family HTH domain
MKPPDTAERIMPSTEHVIQTLKLARQEKHLTQRELSAKAGVPQGHISKIENGAVDLKLSSLVELARTLGLELMLVPRRLVPAVEMLSQGSDPTRPQRPAYTLDEGDGDA